MGDFGGRKAADDDDDDDAEVGAPDTSQNKYRIFDIDQNKARTRSKMGIIEIYKRFPIPCYPEKRI